MKELFRIVIVLSLLTLLVLCATSTCGVENAYANGPDTLCDEQCPSWVPIALGLGTLGLLIFCAVKQMKGGSNE